MRAGLDPAPTRPGPHRQAGGGGGLRPRRPGRRPTSSTSRGHSVTVFERDDRLGGLLMYGIPNMKLEKKIVQRRVDLMAARGRALSVTGVDVGRDRLRAGAAGGVRRGGAVLRRRPAPGPGRARAGRAKGVYFAVDFLKATTKSLLDSDLKDGSYISAKGKHVVVVGGGDTGNDCVGTAIRHGCRVVVQLEMMPKPPDQRAENNPWPEWPRVLQDRLRPGGGHRRLRARTPGSIRPPSRSCMPDEQGNLKAVKIVHLEPEKDREDRAH